MDLQRDEFRREIRIDPVTGERRIILPNVKGDISRLLTSTKGEKIDYFSSGRTNVTVTSPEVPLFLLEETPMSLGDGTIYDRVSGYGADERFGVNSWSKEGLGLLIEAFKARSATLQAIVINGRNIGQTYAYALYNALERTLTGVLLASKEIPPTIMQELKQADSYLEFKKRRLNKDIHTDEATSILSREGNGVTFHDEHRVVDANGDYMSIVPFAPEDQHSIYIFPVDHHTARLVELSSSQSKSLTDLIYQSIITLQMVAKEESRFFTTAYIAMHSAPVIERQQDRIHFGIQNNPSESYDFHVEIRLGGMPFNMAPYTIPSSGWSVVSGRPKQTAERLRNILYEQLS